MSWPAGSLARSSLFTQATLGPGRRAAQALGSLRHPRPDVADGCVDRQGRYAPGPALPGARRPAAIATTATRREAPTIYTSLDGRDDATLGIVCSSPGPKSFIPSGVTPYGLAVVVDRTGENARAGCT